MAIKKSVRLTNNTMKECQALSGSENINWSGSLNAIAERYKLFSNYCLPDLCEAEKSAIAQAYNGRIWHNNLEQEIKMMDWCISEALQYDSNVVHLLESANIDKQSFYEKVKNFSNAERLAVIAFVNHFWNDGRPCFNYSDDVLA